GYTEISPRVVADIVRAGIVVDPTLSVMSKMISAPERFRSGPLANVRRLRAAGATITAGTDAPLGQQPFGESLHHELELLVEAGLSPMEAIQAATTRPASLLKRAQDLGAVRVGAQADLIAVAGNPAMDITAIRNIKLVILGGKVLNGRR